MTLLNFSIKKGKAKVVLVAVGFARGGLKSGAPEADVSCKVVNLHLPDRETIQVPALNEIIQCVIEGESFSSSNTQARPSNL